MTRGKWVALVVGLAAVAVAVPYGPALWMAVAYDRQESSLLSFMIGGRGYSVGRGQGSADPVWKDLKFVVMKKRHSWMPGSEFTVPDQMCPACILEFHDACFPKAGGSAGCSLPDGSSVDLSSSFRCTCPDLSHAQESE